LELVYDVEEDERLAHHSLGPDAAGEGDVLVGKALVEVFQELWNALSSGERF